jgi:hypothetical protein
MGKQQYIHIDDGFYEFVNKAEQLGIVNDVKVRNVIIRHEYVQLRLQSLKYDEAIYQLTEKFFLSYKSIVRIIEGITERTMEQARLHNGQQSNKSTGKETLSSRSRCA